MSTSPKWLLEILTEQACSWGVLGPLIITAPLEMISVARLSTDEAKPLGYIADMTLLQLCLHLVSDMLRVLISHLQ